MKCDINGTKQDFSSVYLSAQPSSRKEQLRTIRGGVARCRRRGGGGEGTTGARARAAAKTHPAPCTATMHSLSNEQHSHPHSSLGHSSPHARWMNQAAARSTKHATCSVSSAESRSRSRPGQFFFMGLAALGPPGTGGTARSPRPSARSPDLAPDLAEHPIGGTT
eukprot:scaffold20601_cov146-Isochrysis_galbana.AAC.3